MRSLITFFIATLLVSGLICAQTTGVPGVNDVQMNAQGEGGTSCVEVRLNAGDPWTTHADTYPFAAMIGTFSTACDVGGTYIDPVYSVDIDANNLTFIYDGTGILFPNAFSPFAIANSAGEFLTIITTTELYRVTFHFQMGIVHPSFPSAIGTSQAYALALTAYPILPGAADLSPLSDDGSINLPFSNVAGFDFYGTTWSDVYVNMNGNLTFGAGSGNFTPTESAMLADEPRIAPAWDDWVPSDGMQGTVRYVDGAGVFAVEWNDVRHSGAVACGGGNQDTNTFGVFLDYGTGNIEFAYGAMLLCQQGLTPSMDTVVGVSPGNGASIPHNLNISAGPHPGINNRAMYEAFGLGVYGPFDLSHLTCCLGHFVIFEPTPNGLGYGVHVQ